jgi:hypothetical protein
LRPQTWYYDVEIGDAVDRHENVCLKLFCSVSVVVSIHSAAFFSRACFLNSAISNMDKIGGTHPQPHCFSCGPLFVEVGGIGSGGGGGGGGAVPLISPQKNADETFTLPSTSFTVPSSEAFSLSTVLEAGSSGCATFTPVAWSGFWFEGFIIVRNA